MTSHLAESLTDLIDRYAESLRERPNGPQIYDFGIGSTVMPKTDDQRNYLTTSVAYLYLHGEGEIKRQDLRNVEEVQDLGHGWKFVAVEIPNDPNSAVLHARLESAKRKLELAVPIG
jgi:hypothetical protein